MFVGCLFWYEFSKLKKILKTNSYLNNRMTFVVLEAEIEILQITWVWSGGTWRLKCL